MGPSGTVLLQRIADGDQSAFAELYDEFAGRLLGFLHRMLRSRESAEEVLQETFLQAWRTAARYDPQRASPVAWLVMIARSRGRDHLRRRARQTDAGPVPEPAAFDDPPAFESNEAARLAQASLGQLPREQRELIELAFYAGLTHQQIAHARGLPLGTVKTRIRTGMQRLRELLHPAGVRA